MKRGKKRKIKKRVFTGEKIRKKRAVLDDTRHGMRINYRKKSAPFIVREGHALTNLWGIAFRAEEKEFIVLTPFKYDVIDAMRAMNFKGQIEMKKAELLAVLPSDNLVQRINVKELL